MINFACTAIKFEELITCSFGLTKTDYNVLLFLLSSGESLTTQEIARTMNLERSTVQKSVKRLAEKNLVLRIQENLDAGGFLFHYQTKNKESIKQKMLKTIETWTDEVKNEIEKW
ncbi:MarR family transcriptional regulator [Candidatus Woesearchaeota archaeon CG_4_10_14_0_8_um_filter_47_5]|nr:MAG: MarR family transcriptional regulator [Candidatus Woesearchaeota archaeon CG_4_10_14_0_8_um_filter_47_5]